MPGIRPLTTIGLDVREPVAPPGDAVTVYELTAPGEGVKLTVASASPLEAARLVGAGGGTVKIHVAPLRPLSS